MDNSTIEYSKILYNIKPLLKQNYNSLSKKPTRIHICCYNIQSSEEMQQTLYHLKNPKMSRNNHPKIPKFFLLYLLHRYTNSDGKQLMIFPFTDNKTNSSPLDTAQKYVKHTLQIKTSEIMGYMKHNGDLYMFFNIPYDIVFESYNGGIVDKYGTIIYSLMDEICNNREVLNFPVNKSVYSLFYDNPELIYLKYMDKNLEIPTVGYKGVTNESLAMILGFGSNLTGGIFGYTSSNVRFNEAFRKALWSTSNIDNFKNTDNIDEFGRFLNPGVILRYAVFLGRHSWHIMYQKSDPFYDIIKMTDIKIDNLKTMERYQEIIDDMNVKWPKLYDSITISPFKLKNIDTIFPYYRANVLRKWSQEIPLALYYPDNKQETPLFWDPKFKYNIE